MFKSLSDLVKSFGKGSNTLLANRYHVLNQLGRGAMGQVYKAIDSQSGDTVAVKFLSQELLNAEMLERFESEAKISALLGEQSKHIVKVRDYGLMDNKIPFYVMEYLEGNDLDYFIKNRTMSISKFLYFTRQICLGIECAHNGILVNGELATIIHRDIKPSNIFLARDEQKRIICKILDFGIAQIRDPDQTESQKSFMGTLKYSSPEQLAEGELTKTSDIYSLGVLMYEMLTQTTPIVTENKNYQGWFKAHHEMIPKPIPNYIQLPENGKAMIMKCLEKSPNNRPQNVGEILRIITPLEREYNGAEEGNVPYKSTSNFFDKDKATSSINDDRTTSARILLFLDEKYQQSTWPEDKPQQKIVFPQLTEATEGIFASLWTMLEKQDVQRLDPQSTFCFNHFLFQLKPHPMILWVNLLYQRNQEPKWLRCYLDLKTKKGCQISRNLAAQGIYYILLFELGKPEKYKQLFTMKIPPEKISEIEKFVEKTASITSVSNTQESKQLLNQKFEKVKVKILRLFDASTR
jgi:serine/threonine-protein kinase